MADARPAALQRGRDILVSGMLESAIPDLLRHVVRDGTSDLAEITGMGAVARSPRTAATFTLTLFRISRSLASNQGGAK
jgi:hypothetical protein